MVPPASYQPPRDSYSMASAYKLKQKGKLMLWESGDDHTLVDVVVSFLLLS